jgi:PAS domain S-box-containing protein
MSGIRSVLNGSDKSINLSIEFMDTKRLNDEAHFENLHRLFVHKYKKDQFKAIITTDNDAFNFMRKYHDVLFPNTPVVFTGVNFFNDEQLNGVTGFTGVVETFDGTQTIELMLNLHPETKRIVIILDGTTTGKMIRSELDGILQAFEHRVQFDFLVNKTLDEIKHSVEALAPGTLVLLMPFARDRDGIVVSYTKIAEWVSSASSVPVYGTWDFYFGHGIVGGRLTDGFSQGTAAAKKVIQVLNGELPQSIPILRTSPTRFMFDSRQLKHFQISQGSLPKDSYLGYQTWYEINFYFVWIGILITVILFILLGLLMVAHFKRHAIKREEEAARKHAEILLEKSRNLLSKLSERVPGVIYQFQIFEDGRFCFPYASKGIQNVYDVTPEQVKEDATPVFSIIHPEDLVSVTKSIKESARTLSDWQAEYRVNLPNLGVRWLSGLSRPEKLDDGSILWHGFIYDITEQKYIAQQLKDSEFRWRYAIEGAGDGLWDWDLIANTVFFSRVWKNMLGYSEEDIGTEIIEREKRLHPDDKLTDLMMVQDCLDGKISSYKNEHRVLCKDGRYKWVLDRGMVVSHDSTGKPLRMIGTQADISLQKEVEQQLKNAKAAADTASKFKSTFLANMSHEIRTPMNAILGMAELLAETQLTHEQQNCVNIFQKSGSHLLSIINDILDISKIESGSFKIEEEIFNIKNILLEVLELFTEKARIKNIVLKTDIPPELHEFVKGDALRLKQVLLNLLGNALKFTPQGTITVSIKHNDDKSLGGNFIIKVIDNGIGISKEQQDKLFQPFSQADSSTTKNHGGTGLGLSISKKLVELMGGTIWMKSTEGTGTSVSFTVECVHSHAAADKVEVKDVVSLHLRELNILIVDDSETNRQLIRAYLKKLKHKITEAENGQIAINKIQEQHFDIILMDIQMPVMDGYEATRRIRMYEKEKALTRSRVIALSAYAQKEEHDKSIASGCDLHLNKPISKNDLLYALKT